MLGGLARYKLQQTHPVASVCKLIMYPLANNHKITKYGPNFLFIDACYSNTQGK